MSGTGERRDVSARDFANHPVKAVRYKDVPGGVENHSLRSIQSCGGGCAAITRVVGNAGACHSRNSIAGNYSDPVVLGVGDEVISRGIKRNSVGIGELCRSRRATVSSVTAAQHRVDGPRTNLADNLVPGVRNVDVAGAIHEHAVWSCQLSAGRRATISAIAVYAGAGKSEDRSC